MRIRAALACSLILLVASSCTRSTEAPPSSAPAQTNPSASQALQPVNDLASFVAALEAEDHAIRVRGKTGFEHVFGGRGRSVAIDGTKVMAFEYESAAAVSKLLSTVHGPGLEYVGQAVIDWCCPRFYSRGRLVVVFLGDRPATVRALTGVLGRPFASVY